VRRRSFVLLALLAACTRGGDATADSSAANPGSTAAATPPPSPANWTMSEAGWGPVRAGTSLGDARTALGGQLAQPANRECDHLRPPGGPAGVLLMVVDGEVARVEVSDSGVVATTAGARVGDAEARINQLYPGRVQTAPHKYTDGHYLTVRGSGADSIHRLVFETDGQRVTHYRGGRMPEVEWVEGCS
jgi:hypothetical protein